MAETNFSHYSVLLSESISLLNVKKDGLYADLTLGGGGHSLEILKKLDGGKLIAFDRDPDAIAASKKRLAAFEDKIIYVNDNYKNIKKRVSELCGTEFKGGFPGFDGVIMDLGVSSYQLDTPERGFSYHTDAPLDMRMNREDPLDAKTVVNTYPKEKLRKIISEYGEEKLADRIAAAIAARREISPINTTLELAETIKSAFPPKMRFSDKHPARRTFQAIRIEVNDELGGLGDTVRDCVDMLKKGGVIAVISFHSLEDRIIKETFRKFTDGCTCPPDFPVCTCGFVPSLRLLTKKPIVADSDELDENSRSRSAKLRAAEKITDLAFFPGES